MNQALTAASLAALLLASCEGKGASPTPPPLPAPKAGPPAASSSEPPVITVKHILVKVAGRTREQAERRAYDVLGRVRKGEDFDKVMKEISEDPGPGTYTMTNRGAPQVPDSTPRDRMVSAFGDVGFRLGVGEVGFAPYDEKASPHGFHVILRVK